MHVRSILGAAGRVRAEQIRAIATACLVLIGVVPRIAGAQSARIGYLDEVRGVDPKGDCGRDYALKGQRGSIALLRGATELTAFPTDSAVVADRLRIRAHTDLRFRVDAQRFGSGNFFLTPELGRCMQAASALRAVGLDAATGDGSYQLASRTERSGRNQVERLVLSVENGAATVEWVKGNLSVIALGREIRDSGTVFTVLVDSARGRALLYVRDGTVAIAGATAQTASAGRAFTFGRTGPLQPVALSTDVLSDVTYHYSTVWGQGYKPGFPYWRVIGGSAVVGGAAVVIAHQIRPRPKGSGPFTGTITVTVP